MIEEGTVAPDFELPDQDGRPMRLSDHGGQTVVLYFYPKADTPGCTAQACGVRDRTPDYQAANAVVLGISRDTPEELRAFADKFGLEFPLLSDPDNRVAELYGIEPVQYTPEISANERTTVVVSAEGTVRNVFRKVDAARHDEIVLGALAPA